MRTITTSWDDGDVLDIRLADLLDRAGVRGTFYIPREYGDTRMSEQDIAHLSTRHEIGAHTLSHCDLAQSTPEVAQTEIAGSKAWIEGIIDSRVEMFCYPRGRFNSLTPQLVREAGFLGARTTRQFSVLMPENPFELDTTLQVYPFPVRYGVGVMHALDPFKERVGGMRVLNVPLMSLVSWERATRAAFDATQDTQGVFHLWGHSWEIEKYGLWEALERILVYIGHRTDCTYMTNGELIKSL